MNASNYVSSSRHNFNKVFYNISNDGDLLLFRPIMQSHVIGTYMLFCIFFYGFLSIFVRPLFILVYCNIFIINVLALAYSLKGYWVVSFSPPDPNGCWLVVAAGGGRVVVVEVG